MSTEKEICQYLCGLGLGVEGTSAFSGVVPEGIGNGFVVTNDTSPFPDADIPTHNPSFRIMVRATEYEAGNTLLRQIRAALHQVSNQTIGSTYYFYILAANEGGWVARDESGHDLFSVAFQTLTRN